MNVNKKPIGIFDSGVGGLTVYKEIREQFPNEDIIYFGDTARVPYGPKSKNNVIKYSIQNARFLIQQGAKIIIVACNTSSSVALPALRELVEVPVIGVIQPGVRSAIKHTINKKIGVIGTEGTIKSEAYQKAIQNLDKSCEVFSAACPMLVPLAEEGWIDHEVTHLIIAEYLSVLLQKKIDTLVLGCTHYPILKSAIKKIVGDNVNLVDSAIEVAKQLEEKIIHRGESQKGSSKFFVSDKTEKFKTIGKSIIGENVSPIQNVKLGESWYLT